eukprot:CAMPEP_0206055572 /NCGR_PEP_ID=MMETSP1466-20131121/40363_1 /ASSEMBLY_ACC=CAM_ASM_001126 /TAXON_ID=44452 /ORGANISM="Pavlova gyrans, Strain CCMP608" /LENGTH=77 /DNA_ID=CAMNT_0053430799 /DNA_START=63 /DNA_END=292 /DNA_ORIENTATION=+
MGCCVSTNSKAPAGFTSATPTAHRSTGGAATDATPSTAVTTTTAMTFEVVFANCHRLVTEAATDPQWLDLNAAVQSR